MYIFFALSIVLILLIVFIFAVFFLMTQYKRLMLYVCMLFVTTGFLLYTAGYLSSGEGFIYTFFAALRGIFSTARMFFVNDDFGYLASTQETQWLTGNTYIQIIFWLSHLSALILIQAAFISLFGRKLIESFRLRFGLHTGVFVIKGCDINAFMLGENIATHDGSLKRYDMKRLVVFLLSEDDNEKKVYEKILHFGGIAKVLDRKNDLPYYLKKAGLGKKSLRKKKYNVILMPNNISVSGDTFLIAEFAKEKKVKHDCLNIFTLTSSEWEREKIEAITQSKENGMRKYPYTFHIISETDLFIRQMIEKHPPFKCPALKFNELGVANRNLKVMILGFGMVGQRALLRLIMNGQFMTRRENCMRAIVVDREIDLLRERFLHCYPSLDDLCCEIEFRDFDVRDDDFFNMLNKINDIDYIVTALGDDEENKRTALDIRLHYERKNETLPFIAVFDRNGVLHEEKQDEEIFIFGCREEIYKESVIIREKADIMAIAVNDGYVKIYGGQPWHELDWFLQESNRATADFIPAMRYLAKDPLKDPQRTGFTEEEVKKMDKLTNNTEHAEILAQTEHLRWNAFNAAMGYRPISINEMRQRFEIHREKLNSLDLARRDSKERLQVCLTSWDKLDDVSDAYRKLADFTDNEKEQERDFKKNDFAIIENIPKFLQAVKDKG